MASQDTGGVEDFFGDAVEIGFKWLEKELGVGTTSSTQDPGKTKEQNRREQEQRIGNVVNQFIEYLPIIVVGIIVVGGFVLLKR